MNPYSYSGTQQGAELKLIQTASRFRRYRVDFPSAYRTAYKEQSVVHGEYFQPQNAERVPLAILTHGMGDHSAVPCRLLARDLVKQGIACFVLYLVFHSSRMPQAIKERLPNLTPEEWFEGYQISVIDVRQVIDWAGSSGKVAGDRIAVVGISLGGIVSAISMGIDKRIGAGVFIVMGGNYESLAWIKKHSKNSSTYEDYVKSQNDYAHYLTTVAENGFENVIPGKRSYLTDPMTFAHALRQRPVLMVSAMWDKYIPRQGTLDFWEACGEPRIIWLPATHAGIWLAYPLISRNIAHFISRSFGL